MCKPCCVGRKMSLAFICITRLIAVNVARRIGLDLEGCLLLTGNHLKPQYPEAAVPRSSPLPRDG